METQIVPCRAEISDRFPVASFAVNVPPARCFEVACATDPRLFHTDWQRYRSPRNFYSSRSDGLMRAPEGHTAWFIPAEQLRRFAGAQRIYYALATYDTAYGGSPEFSISPDALDHIPYIALAGDFTGRGLDRSRLGILPPPPDAYGAVDSATLTWGGDAALAAYRAAAESSPGQGDGYDDGYPKELWHEGEHGAMAGQAGLGDSDEYEDGPPESAASTLGAGDSGDAETYDEGSSYAYPSAADDSEDPDTHAHDVGGEYDYAHAAGDPHDGEYGDEPPAEGSYGGYGGEHHDGDDESYGGYPDAAALYGDGGGHDDEVAGGYQDAAEINAAAAGLDAAAMDDGSGDEPADEDHYGSAWADASAADDGGCGCGPGGGSSYAGAYDDGSYNGNGSGSNGNGAGYGAAAQGESPSGYGDPYDEGPDSYGGSYDDGSDSTYGSVYDPAQGADYEPSYGSVYGGGYDPAQDDGGGVAVADPEVAEGQGAAPAVLTGRDPGYSDTEPEEDLLPVGHASQALAVVPLDIAEKVRILRVVAKAESGADGYTAINPDNEYNDPKHPAYHKYHIGLSWGFIQFTQRSGALGRVLAAIKRREDQLGAALPAQHHLAALFGAQWSELLRVTSAATEDGRVEPVGGKPLWDPSWTARFRAAGQVPHVTYAQNEIAVTDYVDPNLRFAHWLGFNNARALAMLFDRCIHMGNGGGTSWIMRVAGPVKTDEERRAALAALGHADLRAFQQSQAPHLNVDGRWGPKTHAALVAALRGIGSRSPVTIPTRDALLQKLADASSGTGFHRRLTALHTNRADFDDATTYTLV